MNEELEVLKIVVSRLDESGITYMISGSVAANYYTIPRMTRDIDLVVELSKMNQEKILSLFETDFYVSHEALEQAVLCEGMFNLIHNGFLVKVDLIVAKSTEYDRNALANRQKVIVDKVPMWLIRPEDLILSKLRWAKDTLSEVQLKDVQSLFESVGNLDGAYVEKWVERLGLGKLYQKVKA